MLADVTAFRSPQGQLLLQPYEAHIVTETSKSPGLDIPGIGLVSDVSGKITVVVTSSNAKFEGTSVEVRNTYEQRAGVRLHTKTNLWIPRCNSGILRIPETAYGPNVPARSPSHSTPEGFRSDVGVQAPGDGRVNEGLALFLQ